MFTFLSVEGLLSSGGIKRCVLKSKKGKTLNFICEIVSSPVLCDLRFSTFISA
jgi:hypothetical protein